MPKARLKIARHANAGWLHPPVPSPASAGRLIGISQLDEIIRYISHRLKHHAKLGYVEEFGTILKMHYITHEFEEELGRP